VLLKVIRAVLLPVVVVASAYAQVPALLRHFDYDGKAPLDLQESSVEQRGDVAVHDISYASPRGGRVPAYLVVPKGKGPFAAVIWAHWHQEGSELRNRREFLDEAVALAPSGVVSLLPDSTLARRGYNEPNEPLDEHQVDYRVQQILDIRRGADLLLKRDDVDAKRLAYVGHSYNADTGAILAGVDRRFKAFVLMAGTISDDVDMRSKEFQEFRSRYGPAKVDAFIAKYCWLDPGKYVSHAAPAFVFLQYGSQEDYLNPKRAEEYAAVVSRPKKLKIYDAPHALNAEARTDRLEFLAKELHVKPPDPAVIAGIPNLIQPPPPEKN